MTDEPIKTVQVSDQALAGIRAHDTAWNEVAPERWTVVIEHRRADLSTQDLRLVLDAIPGVKTVAIHFEELKA